MQAASETNEHHCVPRSFDGAHCEGNISRMLITEHDRFHQATGHAPPDFLLRRFLIGSVGWKDHDNRSLPPGTYEDVLRLLTPEDWRTLYQDGTFIETHGHSKGESLRRAKAAFHLAWYLDRERSLSMDQIGLLEIHKLLPYGAVEEMRGISRFFKGDSPQAVMRTFLCDTAEDDSLKWARPMREDVRQQLLIILRHSRPEHLADKGASQRIFDLLLDHHARLEECARIWEPNLRDLAGVLKRQPQKP